MEIQMTESERDWLLNKVRIANGGVPWMFSKMFLTTDDNTTIAVFTLDVSDGITIKAQSDEQNGFTNLYAFSIEGSEKNVLKFIDDLMARRKN